MRGKHTYAYRMFDRSTRIGRFDARLDHWIRDGYQLMLFIAAVGAVVGIALGIVGGVLGANKPQPPTVPLTVVETSVQLKDQPYAQATSPDGVNVLLSGVWVEGDRVDAYAHPREEAPNAAPVYSTSSPIDPWAYAFNSAVIGFVLGLALGAGSLALYWRVRGFHYSKVYESHRLVQSAIN